MLTEPKLEQRGQQHYLAIPTRALMDEIGTVVPPLLPELFAWLGDHGVAPAGPPFFRYVAFEQGGGLEIEAGVPVAEPADGDERVRPGALPAGRYATAVHTGHYDGLRAATGQLLDWGEQHGIVWETTPRPGGEAWGARAEIYLTNPDEEPNPERWQTELAFLVAG